MHLLILCGSALSAVAIVCLKSYMTDFEKNYWKTDSKIQYKEILDLKERIEKLTIERAELKDEIDKLQERIDKHNVNCIGKNNKT